MGFAQVWDQIEHDIGFNEHNMRRDRPYNGQPQTITGARGATEIRGITFRDLRDCFVRAVLLSSHGISPAGLYDEATKGEAAAICENDLYGWDLNKLDPMAVAQNLACEIEKLMGIYPNVPALTPNVMLRVTIKSAQIRHDIAAATERDRRSLGQKFRWLLKGCK